MSHQESQLPDPDTLESIDDLEASIKAIIGGPIASIESKEYSDSPMYLSWGWLTQIQIHVRKRTGEPICHEPMGNERKRVAAVANRLGLHFETLLETEPETELRMVYAALRELDFTARD